MSLRPAWMAPADVSHTLQPAVVIFGGGMAAAGDILLRRVREQVQQRVRPSWLADTHLALATLGGDAGWVGAALRAARLSAPDHADASPAAVLTS
jgi:predicted NBD/HSP70 family sugar kinase